MSMWEKMFGKRDRFCLQALNHHLQTLIRNPVVNEGNKDLIIETIREIAEVVTWGDQNNQAMIDFFLEKNILQHLLRILPQKTHKSVKMQIIQTLSILIQNLSNEEAINYILSNNHINEMINHRFDFADEELMGYYISFLKTLSVRLNAGTIHLFFNEREFPLYTEAITFFNHQEHMVRVAVRTLTLNVYRVEDTRVRKFIAEKTAVPYFTNIMWNLRDIYLSMAVALASGMSSDAGKLVDGSVEQTDILLYISDIFNVDVPQLSSILCGRILYHLCKPLILEWIVPSSNKTQQSSAAVSAVVKERLAFNILATFFFVFSHPPLLNPLCRLLFSRRDICLEDVVPVVSRSRSAPKHRLNNNNNSKSSSKSQIGAASRTGSDNGNDKKDSGNNNNNNNGGDSLNEKEQGSASSSGAMTHRQRIDAGLAHGPNDGRWNPEGNDSGDDEEKLFKANPYRLELLGQLVTGDDASAVNALLLLHAVVNNNSISPLLKGAMGLTSQRSRRNRKLLDQLVESSPLTEKPAAAYNMSDLPSGEGIETKVTNEEEKPRIEETEEKTTETTMAEAEAAVAEDDQSAAKDETKNDSSGGNNNDTEGKEEERKSEEEEKEKSGETVASEIVSEMIASVSAAETNEEEEGNKEEIKEEPAQSEETPEQKSETTAVDNNNSSEKTTEEQRQQQQEPVSHHPLEASDSHPLADPLSATTSITTTSPSSLVPPSSARKKPPRPRSSSDDDSSAPPSDINSGLGLHRIIQPGESAFAASSPADSNEASLAAELAEDGAGDMEDGYSLSLVEAVLSLLTRIVNGAHQFRVLTAHLACHFLIETLHNEDSNNNNQQQRSISLSSAHFHRLCELCAQSAEEIKTFLIGPHANLFVDVFEEEYRGFGRTFGNLERNLSDVSLLSPPVSQHSDTIPLHQRLPTSTVESMRVLSTVHLCLHRTFRALSLTATIREYSLPPLSLPSVVPVSIGDTIENVTEYFLLPCVPLTAPLKSDSSSNSISGGGGGGGGGRRGNKKHMMISPNGWVGFLEPDMVRLNAAILSSSVPLQRIEEIRVWSRDPRSLQIVIASSSPKMQWGRGGVRLGLGPKGVAFPGQSASTDSTLTVTFDSETDCSTAKNIISEAREKLLQDRKAAVIDLVSKDWGIESSMLNNNS